LPSYCRFQVTIIFPDTITRGYRTARLFRMPYPNDAGQPEAGLEGKEEADTEGNFCVFL
jgi:hypothetical protein